MDFDFDIEYVKGNSIPDLDTLSKLQFIAEQRERR